MWTWVCGSLLFARYVRRTNPLALYVVLSNFNNTRLAVLYHIKCVCFFFWTSVATLSVRLQHEKLCQPESWFPQHLYRACHEDRGPCPHLYSVIDHLTHIRKTTSRHLRCGSTSCHGVITETVTLNLKELVFGKEKKKDGQIRGREIFFCHVMASRGNGTVLIIPLDRSLLLAHP